MNTYTRAFTVALTAAVFAGVPGGNATAQAYKHTDESGNVTFSDRPPPKGEAAEVIELQKSPATAANDPNATLDEARKYLEEGSEKSATEQAQRKQAKVDDAARKQACEQARERLNALTLGPPNRRMMQDADGTPRRVGSDEMASAIDAARGNVTRACAGN